MKKLGIIIGLALVGCQSSNDLVQYSYFSVGTKDKTKLYLKDIETGRELYKYWTDGTYGDSVEVTLLDTVTFNNLVGNIKPTRTWKSF
jgi:hypothetical protein